MSKNKGFTLVELLAMLVVLGLIIGISIPNISKLLKTQKVNQYKADAISMIETAKMKKIKNKDKPEDGCIVYSLDYLNDSDSINEGPNGGKYDQYESFVKLEKSGSEYVYTVRLIENKNGKLTGINNKTLNDVKSLTESVTISNSVLLGIVKNTNPSDSKSKAQSKTGCAKYYRTYCIKDSSEKYYDKDGNQITEATYNAWCKPLPE